MSELRRFRALDLFKFNPINLDRLTETYNLSFYLSYMATWPDLFLVQHAPSSNSSITAKLENLSLNASQPSTSSHSSTEGRMMGYLMGKLEGRGKDWHSHVTAITVSPEYRRLGVARGMMDGFELSSDQHNGYFVDLFVRTTNAVAIGMYEQFGYSVYRRVLGYYHSSTSGNRDEDEDAFDMRKPLKRDKLRHSVRENGANFLVTPEQVVF